MPVKRSPRTTPSDKKAIDKAIQSLEIAVANDKLDKTSQAPRLKELCRKIGVGQSKTRVAEKSKKKQWEDSRQAAALVRAFPNKSNIVSMAWSVANGKRLRPKYAEGSDAFDKALDYITDKLL